MSNPIDIQNAIAMLTHEGYEVKPPVIEQPKQRGKVSIDDYNRRGYQAIITATGIISESKYPAIKQAIEAILNNDKVGEQDEKMIAFGKRCFYKGFERAEKDDANCFTAWRECAKNLIDGMPEKNDDKVGEEQKPVDWNEHAKNVYSSNVNWQLKEKFLYEGVEWEIEQIFHYKETVGAFSFRNGKVVRDVFPFSGMQKLPSPKPSPLFTMSEIIKCYEKSAPLYSPLFNSFIENLTQSKIK